MTRRRRDGKGMRAVLGALAGRDVPATAQELFIDLRERGHGLGLATVYRALHLLVEQERVHEFHGIDGVGYRVCTGEPHQHLVCMRCGRVQEKPLRIPAAWLDHVEGDGFAVERITIEVQGTCDRCRRDPVARRSWTGWNRSQVA